MKFGRVNIIVGALFFIGSAAILIKGATAK